MGDEHPDYYAGSDTPPATKIDTGGPAFPCEQHETADGTWNQTFEPGMSLRDWFAGQALAGYIAHLGAQNIHAGRCTTESAVEAYAFADAMIAARNGGAL